MATVEHIKPGSTNSGAGEEELQAVQKVLNSLQLARKNYSLYPEDHVNCARALEKFWMELDAYIAAHGNLRFDLGKDRVIFQEEIMLSELPEEGNLAFTLFRDGIQWLEFQEGLELSEVEQFLRIFNKYQVLTDEPEGDLVTALWEARLPHIQYQVADFFWGSEPDMEFKVSSETADADSELLEKNEEKTANSECFPPIDSESLKITPEEEAELQSMVRSEEKRIPAAEYLDALHDSLLQYREQENFISILESLEESLQDSLARREYDNSLKILKNLYHVRKICAAEASWALPIIDNFFLTVSSSHFLRPLQAAWTDSDAEQMEQVKQILVLLQPEAVHTLSVMLLQTSSHRLQQMLMSVIFALASRDLQPLEQMLSRPETELVQKLIFILGRIEGQRATNLLRKTVRHSSADVRHEAVKALLSRGDANIKTLFHLIEDENDSIRRLILRHMSQEREKETEALLLEYLEEDKLQRTDEEHIIACFRTLGRCGSSRSIPFLRKTLFGRAWLPGFRKSAYRQGAAFALQALSLKPAQEVLEAASRSLYPSVKRVARKAMQSQIRPAER